MEPVCLVLILIKDDNVIFYKVDDHINNVTFYIKIDPAENILTFYENETFSKYLGQIDLTFKEINMIPKIKNNIVLMLCAKISPKIKDHIFPEQLSINSH